MDDTPHDAERRTRAVALLALATMGVEVAAGWWFNSMALLADGWHMGTHAAAIGLSALAYALARRWRHDRRFVFGPWKLEMLAAFASALALLAAAGGIAWASLTRLWSPSPIHYEEAIVVAVLGLAVNLLSAWWLRDRPHGHGHGHGHDHSHVHGPARSAAPAGADLNLRAAYLHVLADALTSALAIVALVLGLWLGWAVLDPLIGLLGAALVAHWGLGLLRDTSRVLLDAEGEQAGCAALRERVCRGLEAALPEPHTLRVLELRLWRVGAERWAAALRVATASDRVTAQTVRQMLQRWPELEVLAVEVGPACQPVHPRD
jgi:cation diffusion facilitator family transporter